MNYIVVLTGWEVKDKMLRYHFTEILQVACNPVTDGLSRCYRLLVTVLQRVCKRFTETAWRVL